MRERKSSTTAKYGMCHPSGHHATRPCEYNFRRATCSVSAAGLGSNLGTAERLCTPPAEMGRALERVKRQLSLVPKLELELGSAKLRRRV